MSTWFCISKLRAAARLVALRLSRRYCSMSSTTASRNSLGQNLSGSHCNFHVLVADDVGLQTCDVQENIGWENAPDTT